jgi:predicted adenylyl cyclase CyaB
MIVKNEYKPNIEAQRSGMSEVQIKFKSDISPEILRKAGAERLISVKQTDNYYNPKDRNLSETGEILRIRDEGSTKILTYKGPKAESSYRQRPKFEFEINEDIEKRFLAIYGDRIKIIKKERTLYQLDGIIFSVDMVKKLEEKNETDLGTFLEIRSTDTSMDDKKIRGLIQKLGLKFEDGIKESYAEM